jgi:hypothetical protein
MNSCVTCGREVDPVENWIKCHLWAAFGIFHWRCFSEYMPDRGEQEVEKAIWQTRHVV